MHLNEFQLERYFAKHEFTAKHLLCSSDIEPFLIEDILNFELDSIEKFKKHWLGYTETLGNTELRNSIKNLYKNIDFENILITASSEEAIFLFMNSALEKEDHAIVQFPNYQSLEEVARCTGCEISRWQADENNSWSLDIDFLKRTIKPNTKAIILNTPHNPTGSIIPKSTFDEIIKIARRSNIIVFIDEVYRLLEHNSNDRLPNICDEYENGFSVNGMSKSFSLPGLRIGWIATRNKSILNKMISFKDYTTICSSAPSEFLATIALKNKDKILKRNLEIITTNKKILESFFNKHKNLFSYVLPKAASIAFPKINKDIDIENFCDRLVEDKGIMLLPSTKYDYGNKNFRIGFGRRNFESVLGIFEEYLSRI